MFRATFLAAALLLSTAAAQGAAFDAATVAVEDLAAVDAGGALAGATLSADAISQTVLSAMDPRADPCVDFYRYACGGWLDATKIPSDQARWTRSFSTITEHNREINRQLLEEAAKNPGSDPERRKVGDFYAACMDEDAVDQIGAAPLKAWFAAIDGVQDAASLFAVGARLHRAGAEVLFATAALPDFKDPNTTIAFLSQGGLGMPDRDYYVSDDPKKKELLGKYQEHVARMLALAGEGADAASADAGRIVAFETELAKVSRPRAEMRDRDKLYHKLDRAGLAALAPALPWKSFYDGIGYGDVATVNVTVPEFFAGLEKLVGSTPPDVLRAYLRWQAVHSAADVLARPFVDADFEFYGKTLNGQAEIQPRWKRCVDLTSAALGEAIGRLYVDREFAGNSKQVALEMVRDIEGAFEDNLPNLAWMDETTRQRAIEKARKVTNKIGYPDAWRDYSQLTVTRGDLFADALAANSFEFDRQMRKVGKPTDRAEWRMTPQTVNAYYNPLGNEIVFPAGILQPPFFHKDYPAAMNYGAIGAVIGHELTHGFDDQGRKSDGDGVLREWWEPAVAAKFEQQAACVRDQYSDYEVEPGVKVNGQLTLGENIADNGGLKQAYLAYKGWERRHGAPPPAVAGLTNDQLLFVAFSQVWCTLATPEFQRRQVTIDPHSPGQFRAIGAPSNSAAFGEAFHCAAGTPMRRASQCTVW
ncbi:MAG: M13 family metallopeptidase [Thermoanaerobaculia bacterium]